MAGSMTTYLDNKILDHTLGTTAFPMPTVYIALFTVSPTAAGGGTEVTGGGYVRQPASFHPAASSSATNAQDILFPVATANYGTITAVAIFDALTVGNMLWQGTLSVSKLINTNDQFKITAGNLSVTLN